MKAFGTSVFRHQIFEELGLTHWRGGLWISLVFVTLLAAQWYFLDRYWSQTLQPRLLSTAETQAGFLAQSQTRVLVETIEHTEPAVLSSALFNALQEILIVTDPVTEQPLFVGVSVSLDPDAMNFGDEASMQLSFSEGQLLCESCFSQTQALILNSGELVGVAEFVLSPANYRAMSEDMRSRLFHESLYVVGLLVMVWFVMLFVFHRLHRARLETEASDRAKTRFMANVTHEFRTPLNGILGYTQMFKLDRELMEAHGKGVGTIDQCAEHLLLLINDILDFSKADEASLQLHPEEIDFPDFLKTLIEMAEIRAQNKQLKFVCRFPDELPARLSFDDKRLRQVLLNLLSNAIKFTDSGRVCLELDCPEISYGRARMTFSVTDTGIGIAREDLNRIFVPFQQLDNSVTRAEGSGLGLSISQRLVHLMGSAIQVTSKPGEGSCFRFQLNLPVVSSERVAVTCDRYRASRELSPAWEGDMAVPDSSQIASLSAAAKQHNITAVRNLLSSMKDQQELAAFVEKAEQMMSQYRFKPMADWLDSLCEVRTEEGSNAPQNS